MAIIKGNLRKKYELLKSDYEKLLKEALLAGEVIKSLKDKIYKYETLLNADEREKDRAFLKISDTNAKLRQLVEVKDQLITEKEARINKIVDALVHKYGLEETEKLVNDILDQPKETVAPNNSELRQWG